MPLDYAVKQCNSVFLITKYMAWALVSLLVQPRYIDIVIYVMTCSYIMIWHKQKSLLILPTTYGCLVTEVRSTFFGQQMHLYGKHTLIICILLHMNHPTKFIVVWILLFSSMNCCTKCNIRVELTQACPNKESYCVSSNILQIC